MEQIYWDDERVREILNSVVTSCQSEARTNNVILPELFKLAGETIRKPTQFASINDAVIQEDLPFDSDSEDYDVGDGDEDEDESESYIRSNDETINDNDENNTQTDTALAANDDDELSTALYDIKTERHAKEDFLITTKQLLQAAELSAGGD
jgi:hypothetical protein